MVAITRNLPDINNDPFSFDIVPKGRSTAAESKSFNFASDDLTIMTDLKNACVALAAAVDALTDTDGNLKAAFYDGVTPVDPTAAGAVIGGTAAGADIAFAPVTTGGKVLLAAQTALASGKVTDAWFDSLGRQSMTPYPLDIQTSQQATISNSTSPVNIVTAGSAGKKRHILVLTITNESTTTDSLVTISDGTQTRYWWAKAGLTVGVPLPSGVVWKATTAATAWTATTAVANAANIRFDTTYAEI
jgi:hypothetical protein